MPPSPRKCERCGEKANTAYTLHMTITGPRGAVGRAWGGPDRGTIDLCENCVFELDKIGGTAIAAEFPKARGR